jgi:cytochrome P450
MTLSSIVPKPSHVADKAVYDFDFFQDAALLADPHERVRSLLREAPPVFWTPRNGGHWRQEKAHIAFGVGPHRCLGSHLARIELQIIYERMLARLPTFRLDPANPARFHGGNIIAMDTLPLRWD